MIYSADIMYFYYVYMCWSFARRKRHPRQKNVYLVTRYVLSYYTSITDPKSKRSHNNQSYRADS